jgi:hypothetical protein
MPFGRSDAGLDSFSDYGASVVQRMRKSARAQHVVSTIICWCFHSAGVGGDFDVNQVDSSQSRHCSPRMNHTAIPVPSRRRSGIAVAERVFPVL